MISLLFNLAHAREVFAGVNPGNDLAGLDKVAFAHRQALQLTRHTGLDDG